MSLLHTSFPSRFVTSPYLSPNLFQNFVLKVQRGGHINCDARRATESHSSTPV